MSGQCLRNGCLIFGKCLQLLKTARELLRGQCPTASSGNAKTICATLTTRSIYFDVYIELHFSPRVMFILGPTRSREHSLWP